jgi:hypothetical protein
MILQGWRRNISTNDKASNMFVTEEYRFRFIRQKLAHLNSISSITPLIHWPKSITYIAWSFGSEAERDYRYEVLLDDSTIIVCQITTLFNLFIVQSRFYIKDKQKYEVLKM